MDRAHAVVKYGRGVMGLLSWALVAVVLLPNGSYQSGSAATHLDALSSPFDDYGGSEIALASIVALAVGVMWATGWRPRQSAYCFVFLSAGTLGFMLPDLWTRNSVARLAGTRWQTMAIHLEYGFWLNLLLVAALLAISLVVLWNERHRQGASELGTH